MAADFPGRTGAVRTADDRLGNVLARLRSLADLPQQRWPVGATAAAHRCRRRRQDRADRLFAGVVRCGATGVGKTGGRATDPACDRRHLVGAGAGGSGRRPELHRPSAGWRRAGSVFQRLCLSRQGGAVLSQGKPVAAQRQLAVDAPAGTVFRIRRSRLRTCHGGQTASLAAAPWNEREHRRTQVAGVGCRSQYAHVEQAGNRSPHTARWRAASGQNVSPGLRHRTWTPRPNCKS